MRVAAVVWAAMGLGIAQATYSDLSDALLREMVSRMGSGLADPAREFLAMQQGMELPLDGIPPRAMKEFPEGPLDYDSFALSPVLRDQEFLSHSSLLGSVLGDYDGKSKLRPKNQDRSAGEGVLPAYCNPPNPCPIGYTAADGCLEEFENSAGFSRDYQGLQDCMCDTEHMFECRDSTQDSQLTAIARSIQNEGVMDTALDKLMENLDGAPRMVAKKFHMKKNTNPYLQGEKLPIAAKKGGSFLNY